MPFQFVTFFGRGLYHISIPNLRKKCISYYFIQLLSNYYPFIRIYTWIHHYTILLSQLSIIWIISMILIPVYQCIPYPSQLRLTRLLNRRRLVSRLLSVSQSFGRVLDERRAGDVGDEFFPVRGEREQLPKISGWILYMWYGRYNYSWYGGYNGL